MAIQHDIYLAILNGAIGRVFSAADLKRTESGTAGRYRVGISTYAGNYLNSVLPNRSVNRDGSSEGDSVKRGQPALFYREEERGAYSLIGNIELGQFAVPQEELSEDELPDTLEDAIQADEDTTARYVVVDNSCISPAEIVFQTIERSPYQAYFRKQKCLHPQQPANGWAQRLKSYFWPTLAGDWHANAPKLTQFENRFCMIDFAAKKSSDEADLLQLFREICAWGGVKLPNITASDLYSIVTDTLRLVDSGTVPIGNPLNSAWTKLYAIARPQSFVIYDSRVATSLVSILDPYMKKCAATRSFLKYENLGYVNGRGGTRPRLLTWNWPNGYMNWDAQFAANELCNDVRILLNRKGVEGRSGWTLREVEAVLFMDGY